MPFTVQAGFIIIEAIKISVPEIWMAGNEQWTASWSQTLEWAWMLSLLSLYWPLFSLTDICHKNGNIPIIAGLITNHLTSIDFMHLGLVSWAFWTLSHALQDFFWLACATQHCNNLSNDFKFCIIFIKRYADQNISQSLLKTCLVLLQPNFKLNQAQWRHAGCGSCCPCACGMSYKINNFLRNMRIWGLKGVVKG